MSIEKSFSKSVLLTIPTRFSYHSPDLALAAFATPAGL